MKKFYSKPVRTLLLGAVGLMGMTALQAQDPVTITWNGSVSTDASIPENWTPVGGMDGNDIVVPHVGDYADPNAPNHPVVNRDSELFIRTLGVAASYYFEDPIVDAEGNPVVDENGEATFNIIEHPKGEITFAMPEGIQTRITGNSTYLGGRVTVSSGILSTNRNFYLENLDSELIIEGTGRGVFDSYFLFSKDGNAVSGGKIFLRDQGELYLSARIIDRWSSNPENSVLTIEDDAFIRLKGDHRGYLGTRLGTGQLTGGENFYPIFYYDMAEDMTYVYAKPQGTAYLHLTSRFAPRVERVIEGVAGAEVGIAMHTALEGAQQFVWKYGTQSGGPYDVTMSTSTESNLFSPTFATAGTYFMVCEVTLAGGEVVQSNEIEYLVAPDLILLDHLQMQYVRGGRAGATVTAVIKDGITAEPGEWKFATVSGGPYESFATAETALEYAPQFDTPGAYYVVYQAMIDGELATSPELIVNAQDEADAPLALVWTGADSDDFSHAYNWTPAAHPHNNNVIVTVDAPYWPVVYPGSGEITIKNGTELHYKAAVTEIVDEVETVLEEAVQATLIVRSGEGDVLYLDGRFEKVGAGKFVVESGTFSKIGTNGWLELRENHSRLIVKGTGVAVFDVMDAWDSGLLMLANSSGISAGGEVHVSENGKVLFRGGIARISGNKDAEFSRIKLTDNGQFIFMGDASKKVGAYMANNRFYSDEGFEPVSFFSASEDITPVYVRDMSEFSIEQGETLYLSVGEVSPAFGLINTGELADFEWKFNQDPLSEWTSFATPVTGASGVVSFDTPGTYFVAAEAGDGTRTNNFVKAVVFDFKVDFVEDAGSYTLSVVLPEGAKASGWFEQAPGETEYAVSDLGGAELSYTLEPFFMADGEHLITYQAILKDEADQDVNIMAVPVVVTISNGAITSVDAGVGTSIGDVKVLPLGVSPNPSEGTFTLTVDADSYVVEVIDFTGAVVQRQQFSGRSNTVTINNKGVFILRVVSADGVGVQRVVIN
ncbi:T9SS type A sorting domain-containing protein [Geofilum rhodophaeum]|uniref:T9SS type A sorting domain-containing protein n=1 Tax=Geofilum rhodophaeum TaxID=1965019 RepID=UPI0013147AF1|nr:T9SS type A sorting domain-containing protein [Geofilum rhodophaeum]